MTRKLMALLFAWYVMTTSGSRVAGPFTLLDDCEEVRKFMAKRYQNISLICRNFVQ